MKENKVAKIFKVYSIINAAVVILASIIIAANEEEVLYFIAGASVGIFINFLLYACGELIQLLQDIKDNTAKSIPSAAVILPDEDEIPTL